MKPPTRPRDALDEVTCPQYRREPRDGHEHLWLRTVPDTDYHCQRCGLPERDQEAPGTFRNGDEI